MIKYDTVDTSSNNHARRSPDAKKLRSCFLHMKISLGRVDFFAELLRRTSSTILRIAKNLRAIEIREKLLRVVFFEARDVFALLDASSSSCFIIAWMICLA